MWNLESTPGHLNTLHDTNTHTHAHTDTGDNLEMPNNLQCKTLDWGRKPGYQEESPETWQEHTNSTQRCETSVLTVFPIHLIICHIMYRTCRKAENETDTTNRSPVMGLKLWTHDHIHRHSRLEKSPAHTSLLVTRVAASPVEIWPCKWDRWT